MLTPVEIQAKTFKSGGLGYDKKDVESFMREVTRSYEILYRENMELKDKVAVLNEGIQYYKSIEKTFYLHHHQLPGICRQKQGIHLRSTVGQHKYRKQVYRYRLKKRECYKL